jgi:hypothetical protein
MAEDGKLVVQDSQVVNDILGALRSLILKCVDALQEVVHTVVPFNRSAGMCVAISRNLVTMAETLDSMFFCVLTVCA